MYFLQKMFCEADYVLYLSTVFIAKFDGRCFYEP